MRYLRIAAVQLGMMIPVMALANSAVGNANFNWVTTVMVQTSLVVAQLIPLLIGIALLVFIWGVVKFISADDDSSRNDGKKKIAWGVIGLFVIVSAWGLVYLVQTLAGISGATSLTNYPQIPALTNTTPGTP